MTDPYRAGTTRPANELGYTWVTPEIRADYESRGLWTEEAWLDHFLDSADRQPDRLAVADESGELTFAEASAQAEVLAGYLTSEAVGPGDVVAVILPNWREFYVVHAAIAMVGAVICPILPRLGKNEIKHVVATAGVSLVFAAAEHRHVQPAAVARQVIAELGLSASIVSVRGDVAGTDRYEDVMARRWTPTTRASVDARAWDTVTFTSGTESSPKGVVHTHQSTMFGLRTYVGEVLGLSQDDCVFMPSPVCHASGLQWGLRTAVFSRAPLVLQDRWDPDSALELIDHYRATYTLVATPFIVDLVRAAADRSPSGTSLRYVASGGAPIPRDLVGKVSNAFGAELMSVFGASETYVATATRPGDQVDDLATDGIALPHVTVAVIGADGQPKPPGVEGEIVNRGPNAFLGYLGDPGLTKRSFTGSSYHFGDLGVMDDRSRLRVTGRIKDIVIRGGENISVREIEEMLSQHPDVAAVSVIGYPDDRLGERCCAVVVPVVGATPSLQGLCSYLEDRQLPRFKLPEILCLTDVLPMTATGKIRKAELVRQVVRTHGPDSRAE